MKKKTIIYFLSTFILLLGCYVLNLSYSLFTQNIVLDNKIETTIPRLEVALESNGIETYDKVLYNIPANSKQIIKFKIKNSSLTDVNYDIIIEDTKGLIVKRVIGFDTFGIVKAQDYEEIWFYVENNTEFEVNNLEIKLNKNYITIPLIENEHTKKLEMINLLSGNIVNNSKHNINGTEYIKNTKTKVAEEVNGLDEKTLSLTEDDYGLSYFYRGNVIDNYVNFANKCWKIVRIAGDGSVKLILEDQDQLCDSKDTEGNLNMNGNWDIPISSTSTSTTGYYGFKHYGIGKLTASDGTTNATSTFTMDLLHSAINGAFRPIYKVLTNFQSTFTNEQLAYMKSGDWCLNDKAYIKDEITGEYIPIDSQQRIDNIVYGKEIYYDAYVRLSGKNGYQPTLKCNGNILNDWDDVTENPTPMYVSTITADEATYAGSKNSNHTNYYMYNNYHDVQNIGFWLITPSYFIKRTDVYSDYAYMVNTGGAVQQEVDVYNSVYVSFRPAISLKFDTILINGTGIQSDPYEIEIIETTQ